MGIGGSATNDGGFGMARALGWKFLNSTGRLIARWIHLDDLRHIEPPATRSWPGKISVAVDVQNPLLGMKGASRVYGPQKGLREHDFAHAEACLAQLTEVVALDLGRDVASEPGTGAAGGLGFGLRAFLDAQLESGFSLFARYSRLEERIRNSDLVLTGEGAIDASTLMGKGVGEIAVLCRRLGVACAGLTGTLSLTLTNDEIDNPFTKLYGIVPQLASLEAATREPARWLGRLAATAAREPIWAS
jgi:glycerate kinase